MQLYEIAQQVKILRKEKKLTQQQLSELSNISRVTLGKIERGELGAVTVKTLDIILRALDYELDIKPCTSFGLPTLGEQTF